MVDNQYNVNAFIKAMADLEHDDPERAPTYLTDPPQTSELPSLLQRQAA